jgi:hypothetical protein
LSLSWWEQNSNATLNLETLDLVVNWDKLNLKEFYEKNEGISWNPEKIEFSSWYKLIKDS